MKITDLQKLKRVLIYGYAKQGQSTERFLRRHAPHLTIDIFDAGVKKFAKAKSLSSYGAIFVTAGIGREKLMGADPKKLSSNTELFFNNLSEDARKRIIGITGTKGKSTTTKFMTELLTHAGFKAKAAGNYGIPILDFYDAVQKGKLDYLVAELSSYQLEYLKVSPGLAIFLNIFPDHLDRHGTMKKYTQAKNSIWKYQKAGDTLIIPEASRKTVLIDKKYVGKLLYAKAAPASLFPKNSIFQAKHLLEDIGAAISLAKCISVTNKDITATAKTFKGLPHRLELFAIKRGIHFCDDAISVNPTAAIASVHAFGNKLGSIILGGQNRKQRFDELIKAIRNTNAAVLVLESETSTAIVASLKKQKYTHYVEVRSLRDAVTAALEHTPAGKICTLSPAAPSYDSFKSFEEKGDYFKKIINAL
jgi:UDP-N-acetylmuramoylalanine--D-glutamate ligase